MRRFLDKHKIVKAWEKFVVDFTYMFEDTVNNITTTSVVDHVIVSPGILNNISDGGTIHLPQNMSNHEPIYVVINMNSGLINENVDQTEPEARPRQAWNSATDEQKLEYKNILELKLNQIVKLLRSILFYLLLSKKICR